MDGVNFLVFVCHAVHVYSGRSWKILFCTDLHNRSCFFLFFYLRSHLANKMDILSYRYELVFLVLAMRRCVLPCLQRKHGQRVWPSPKTWPWCSAQRRCHGLPIYWEAILSVMPSCKDDRSDFSNPFWPFKCLLAYFVPQQHPGRSRQPEPAVGLLVRAIVIAFVVGCRCAVLLRCG